MSLATNAAFDRLLAELARMGAEAQQSPTQAEAYQRFIQRFPAAKLTDLSLDAYCVGKGDGESFCWWLERGLESVLGRYSPGTSRGHLLYFGKDQSLYKNHALKDLPDQEALGYTLKVHAAIAGADPTQDLRWVDDDTQIYARAGLEPRVTMGDGRKLRLLAAYHPDTVVPINSSDHVAHFLRAMGCPPTQMPPAHAPVARMLMLRNYFDAARQQCPAITTHGFMKALYAPALGLAPPRHVDEVLAHFAMVPGLAECLQAAGQTDAFCQLTLALHEADLDWWVTQAQEIHAGRTDDPKVSQTVVALAMKCTSQGMSVRLQGASDAGDSADFDTGTHAAWLPLDGDLSARMVDAASTDTRVPALQGREACWPDDYDGSDTILSVLLTKGAIGNGYVKVPKLQALFPNESIAPDEKARPAAPFQLVLPNGEQIETWVQANRNRIRARFNSLFAQAGLSEGDRAVIEKVGDGSYRMTWGRKAGTVPATPSAPLIANKTTPVTTSASTSMTEPLNQILFGPPGTGKTYATVSAALAILDPTFLALHREDRKALKARFDALAEDQRVRFVTFHQSFSYEDFVEGLRATTDEDTKQLRYEVMDGVFKSICNTAEALAAPQKVAVASGISVKGRRIWKMSLGDTQGPDAVVYDECLAGNFILLGYGGEVDFSGCTTREAVAEKYRAAGTNIEKVQHDYAVTSVLTFVKQMEKGDLVVVTDGNQKFRAIGEIVGDYEFEPHASLEGYSQMRAMRWLRDYTPSVPFTELMRKKFSQMTLYELRPSSIDLEKLHRLLNDSPTSDNDDWLQLDAVGNSAYVVNKVTAEIVELTKPNGNQISFSRAMLDVLAQGVTTGLITIEDIRNKRAVAKLPGKGLEPFLVNGYQNILALLVEQITTHRTPAPIEAAEKSPKYEARVLIIDEINRGNIARIFGELITLIEPSKRAGADESLEVVLPYSKEPFSVPRNVYIIGTMNTADRSLAGLDVALRRRFVFQEMSPRPELLDDVTVKGMEGLAVGQLLRTMNHRIEALLDRDHCLGHAYFMPLREEPTIGRLGGIFRNQVLPLLQEYFFDDWQRIQWVLNDHRKPVELQFVQSTGMNVAELFGNDVNVARDPQSWRINCTAFERAESYRGIVGTVGTPDDAGAPSS